MHAQAHFDPPKDQSHQFIGLTHGAIILLTATVLGVFFAAQMYFSAAAFQRNISWGQAFYWSFGDWYEWALLSPIIFWGCRKYRFDRAAWPRSLVFHL